MFVDDQFLDLSHSGVNFSSQRLIIVIQSVEKEILIRHDLIFKPILNHPSPLSFSSPQAHYYPTYPHNKEWLFQVVLLPI